MPSACDPRQAHKPVILAFMEQVATDLRVKHKNPWPIRSAKYWILREDEEPFSMKWCCFGMGLDYESCKAKFMELASSS